MEALDLTRYGWALAAFAAACGILLMLLRQRRLDAWLDARKLKRWKPLLAALLGAACAVLGALLAGVVTPEQLANLAMAGATAGLAATGGHNLLTVATDAGQGSDDAGDPPADGG